MNTARLRAGEITAGTGALALIVLLFMHWAKPETSVLRDPGAELPRGLSAIADRAVGAFVDRLAQSGFTTLGWFLVAMLLVAAAGGLALVALTVTEQETPVLAVVVATVTIGWSLVTFVVLLVRLTLAQPDLGLGLASERVDMLLPSLLGLLALGAIGVGAWLTLRDDRVDSPYSVAPAVPVRPVPPAAA